MKIKQSIISLFGSLILGVLILSPNMSMASPGDTYGATMCKSSGGSWKYTGSVTDGARNGICTCPEELILFNISCVTKQKNTQLKQQIQ
jgi:hypothetical protein